MSILTTKAGGTTTTTSATVTVEENTENLQMDPSVFTELQKLPGNKICVDCGEKEPDWGSPALGILFCFQCSGKHRGLGTHISFVRSVRMDIWTEKQIELMKAGGNTRCNEFLKEKGLENLENLTAAEKYDTPQAELYKQVLLAEYEGKPIPTELPPPREKKKMSSRKMEGFGSSPPPPPSGSNTNRHNRARAFFSRHYKAILAIGACIVAAAAGLAMYFLL